MPIVGKLIELGLPGLIIAYLIWRSRTLETEIDKRDKIIHELFEKRQIEAVENVRVLGRNEASNDKLSQALVLIAEKVNRNYELLDRMDRERK